MSDSCPAKPACTIPGGRASVRAAFGMGSDGASPSHKHEGSFSRCASSAEWDAIVIGAGPAGALAARRLALAGARILLIDKKAFPRSKVCGACLNQDALDALRSEGLGALVEGNGGIPLCAFRVGLGRRVAQFTLPEGRALSREKFDLALVSAAIAAGAVLLPQTLASVEPCAAGRRSRRCALIDMESRPPRRPRWCLSRRASVIAPSNLCRRSKRESPRERASAPAAFLMRVVPNMVRGSFTWLSGGAVTSESCGWRTSDSTSGRHSTDHSSARPARPGAAAIVLDEAGFPRIDALQGAPWHGTVALTQRTSPVALHRLMLIGDATGYVEPFTGQGMACALASARAVAPLALGGIESWSSALEREWSARHRALFGRRLWLCRTLAAAARQPFVARAAFMLAARVPQLSRLLIDQVSAGHGLVEASGACP